MQDQRELQLEPKTIRHNDLKGASYDLKQQTVELK